MAKTAKAKPTVNTVTRTKKSTTSRKTAVRTKSNNNELPSPPRVTRNNTAQQGSLVNPTDVDDPALSTVNPSVTEINYDVSPARATRSQAKKATDVHDPDLFTVNASVTEITSPARATQSRAKKAIGDDNFWDKVGDNGTDLVVDHGTDLEYDSDSKDEDYRGDVYDDDFSDGEESLGQYRVPSARGNGAGRKPKAGRPPKPDTTGMSEEDASAALTDWGKKWKRDNDTNRRTAAAAAALQEFDESLDLSGHQFTGVCSRTLREMKDVELHPLRKGDTFPNKELVMLRIAEEANLFAIRIQTRRSDLFQLQVYGAGGDPFHVHANYRTAKNMWVSQNVKSGLEEQSMSQGGVLHLIMDKMGYFQCLTR